MDNKCLQCGKEANRKIFKKYKNKIYSYNYSDAKFCSSKCYHSFYKGKPLTGKALKNAQTSVRKAIDVRKNNPEIRERWLKKMRDRCGPKCPAWIKDRSKVVSQDERNGFKYLKWRKAVIVRDNYKCRLEDEYCDESLEVHHILSWREYPRLRYKLNNGITLCHAHHPRIRREEKKLISVFKNLINN